MNPAINFYPMSQYPEADESDPSFSQTVLVYGDNLNFVELGYYDFEKKLWAHFGEGSFLLKCWCYIPSPEAFIKAKQPVGVKHLNYKHLW